MTSPYGCAEAREDMAFFFQEMKHHIDPESEQAALDRALSHMTIGSTVGHHNVSCQTCWNRYQKLKQMFCGG